MKTTLSLRDLCVTYGSGDQAVAAVQNVNLDIHPGEIYGLAGESGCGKSTLGLSVLRLLPHSAHITGEILYNGQNLQTMKWSQVRAVRWAGISMVFQSAMSSLNPVQTIGRQICEAIVLHGTSDDAPARAKDLLEQVGLGSRRFSTYPHELSGGQRQRAMIAMALACDPDLIVADEPTTALDVMVQAQVLDLLTSLVRAKNISVLLISHDLSVLADTCDRIAVMYAGRLVETSPAQRLFAKPSHPYSRGLAQAFPMIGDPASRMNPSGLPGYPAVARPGQIGCPFAPRCAYAIDACRTADVKLSPVDGETSVACIRFLPEHPPLPAGSDRERDGSAPVGEPRIGDTFVLAANNARLVYPARRRNPPAIAVDGIDLSLRSHEIVALIGESGCGKSTLARMLVGLLQPTSGTIEYRGKQLSYVPHAMREFRKNVQMVLQDPASALNPQQDIYAAVAEGLRVHNDTTDLTAHVEESMETVGLHPVETYEDRFPYELSGGQLQRAVIAGALTLHPSVIVADEPVSSLDASARGEILSLLLRLRNELGTASLIVSHDLGLAWNIADRVAVMYLGRIVEIGNAETVLLSPKHPYTRALLSVLVTRGNEGNPQPTILQGEGPDPTHIPTGCRFRPRCPLFAGLAPDDPLRQRCIDEDPHLRTADDGVEVACHHHSPGTFIRVTAPGARGSAVRS